jgi:MFS transporter, ACS family, D-galactonate transporter
MSITREARTNIGLIVGCQAVHFLTLGGLALFLPLIREDLGISFAQAGLLSGAATLTYALGQVPAGYLADRLGPRRLFLAGLAGWSFFTLVLTLLHAYWAALLALLIGGAFRALVFAPGMTVLASWFPKERRATAMSLFMVGGFAGTAILGLLGPLLVQHLGWRTTFGLFAAAGLAGALVYWMRASDRGATPGVARLGAGEAAALVRQPILWVCSALQFVRFSVVTAFALWLPSLLLTDRGFSLVGAGLVLAMSAALSAPANALGGYLSDRLRNPPLVIGASLAILACTSMLLVTVEALFALLMVVAMTSIFMQFYFGSLFLVPVEVLGARTAGTVTGISNLFANLGGLTTAYALGAVKDVTGSFTWGFVGIGMLCVSGVALSIVLAGMRKHALARGEAKRASIDKLVPRLR